MTELQKNIVKANREGLTTIEIAARCFCAYDYAYTTQRELGLEVNKAKTGRKPRIDLEKLRKMVELGWKNTEMAAKLRVSVSCVKKTRVREGI